MKLNFSGFNTGSLFLVRTPDVFPEGYAEKSFKDMKENLHFDFASWLETWNCADGVLWKSDKFPRSSYWKDEERDPIEECFIAADKYGMAFLPEAGMMHEEFMLSHKDGMQTAYSGNFQRYGRIGLSPSCPLTLEYFVQKYEAMLDKFKDHQSCKGICMPAENGIYLTYDKYTRDAYRAAFGTELPDPEEIASSSVLENQVFRFLEDRFLLMYRKLAKHLKDKYNLPLMHYPIDKISEDSFMQPSWPHPNKNIAVMNQVKELDMLNLQLHPPLFPNPYFFKLETEYLMANSDNIPCMADTHFYHEMAAGRLPDTTPKRVVDNILSTLTPYGISFFCYGFMAEELPLWKKGLKPGVPVYKAYDEPNTLKARRDMCIKSMDFVEQLRPMMENTKHTADCAIYFPEELNIEYMYSSYATEHIFGLHELFNAAAVPLKITASIPQSAKAQKMLIMDSVRRLSDTDTRKLKNYLASGGKLLLIGKCCKEIEDIAGVNTVLSDARLIQSPYSPEYNRMEIKLPLDGKHYYETIGKPILCYEDGTAAITEKENVLFFGAADQIGRFSQYRDFRLVTWLKEYLEKNALNTGVKFNNTYVGAKDRHQFVSCDIYENDNKKLLFLRNFGVEHHYSTLSWDLPEDFKIVKALADGNEFTFESGKNLPMFEHFIAIYAEKQL